MTKLIKLSIAAATASVLAISVANAETQNFDIQDFKILDASAGVNVEATVGGDYSIRAEGTSEALEKLRIERRNDALEIGRKRTKGFNWNVKPHTVTVYVTMPSLDGVEVSSGAELTATGIDAAKFSADVSSGAEATLSGNCDDLSADGSSGAELEAEGLKCANAAADVSSGADLTIYASESVTADASSGGQITVYGGPKNTNIDKSSGGSVSIRD